MRTITLEDGTKIKISQESYESLKGAVTKKPWVPESGDMYFFLTDDGVSSTRWNGSGFDKRRFVRDNVRRTRVEAEAVDQKRLAKKRIRDHAGGQSWIDWSNGMQSKYHIYYNHNNKRLNIRECVTYQSHVVAHYSSKEMTEEAIEKHGDDYKIVFGAK